MNQKLRLANLFFVAMLMLSACNLPSSNPEDTSATSAAQTVEALLSATAPVISTTATPSITPPATITLLPPPPAFTSTPSATATSNCNVAQFVADVTIPDGTVMTPGQAFTKKWRIKNIGSCTWNGYSMVFDSGDAMGGPATKPIAAVNPGQEVDLEVSLPAPASAGNYRGYWRIVTNGNVLVPVVSGYQGKSFYVDVKVQAPVAATNTTAPLFAVTSVNLVSTTFDEPGYTACPKVIAQITTNGPGTVTFHFTRSDGTSGASKTLIFASAGTQNVEEKWYLGSGASGSGFWIGVYIDEPNHQDFGHANVNKCTAP